MASRAHDVVQRGVEGLREILKRTGDRHSHLLATGRADDAQGGPGGVGWC